MNCPCDKPRGGKKRKYHQAPEAFEPPSIEPCVHCYFKTEPLPRECMTREECLDMLATPKRYAWLGEAGFEKPELNGKKSKKNKHLRRHEEISAKPDIRCMDFAEEFVNDIWDVMSPDVTDRLIDFLVNEFGISVEEAEDFIDCKSSVGKPTPSVKNQFKPIVSLGSKHKWVKKFSEVFANRIEQYIVSMLMARKSPRIKRIAERILNDICEITGDKTSLQYPKTKPEKTMVLIATRLAFWFEDIMQDLDKPRKERPSITEEEECEEEKDPEEREREDEEEVEEEREKVLPKEEKKPEQGGTEKRELKPANHKSKEKPQAEEKLSTEEENPSTEEETPSTEEEKPSTEEEKPSTEEEKPSTKEEKPSTKEEKPSTKDENPSTKEENPSTKEEKPSTKEENPSTKEENPSTKEEKPSTKEEKPSTKEEKPYTEEGAAEEEEVAEVERPTEEGVEEKEQPPADGDKPGEAEKPQKEDVVDEDKPAEDIAEKGKPPDEEVIKEEEPAEEVKEKEKPPEEEVVTTKEDKPTKKSEIEAEELAKKVIEATEPDKGKVPDTKEKPKDVEAEEEELATVLKDAVKVKEAPPEEEVKAEEEPVEDETSEEVVSLEKIPFWDEYKSLILPGRRDKRNISKPTFRVRRITGSTLLIQHLSSGTVVEQTIQARGLSVPPAHEVQPVSPSESPINLRLAEEWVDWATNIASIAEEWGKWLEGRFTDAEKQLSEKRKRSDWKAWMDQAENEALKWRVEEERIKKEGKRWGEKLGKSKNQSETILKTTELS